MARREDHEYEALKTAREMAAERTRAAMERAAPYFEKRVEIIEEKDSRDAVRGR
jgi:bisphosphoglycerate-dependent phosphoglycerate mutase